MKCAAILLASAQVVSAVLLRAPAPLNASASVVAASEKEAADDAADRSVLADVAASDNSSAADQALKAVATLLSAHNTKPVRHVAPANASLHRAKVDLGFTEFENALAQRVESGVRNATEDAQWTGELRQSLMANITGSVNATLNSELKPLKMSIGQTWMGLPDPDQQDEYVAQLRSAFAPILSTASDKILGHFGFGVKRVQAYGRSKLSPKDLVAKSEKTLLDSLVNERCYGGSFAQLRALHESTPPAKQVAKKNSTAAKKVDRFCIPPQLFAFAGNLNDTQGLISMGFKFEAHALQLVQIM